MKTSTPASKPAPAIRSAIDLGTNTCLLLVMDATGTALHDECRVVRLGQGVDRERRLQPEAIERTLACLADYASRLRELGGDPAATRAVATSQARDAANAAEFFAEVGRRTGFRFRTISGEEEARLTFLGALLPGMDPARTAVIDIGGGSTEIITAGGGLSQDLGGVRYTERHLKSDPVTDDEFWACEAAIDEALGAPAAGRPDSFLDWRSRHPDAELVAVAGTPTTLAAWHLGLARFEARAIDGTRLTRGDVHRMVEELKWRTVAERSALPGMDPERADIILAGAQILWRVMERLGFGSLTVSTRGLRYGALAGAGTETR